MADLLTNFNSDRARALSLRALLVSGLVVVLAIGDGREIWAQAVIDREILGPEIEGAEPPAGEPRRAGNVAPSGGLAGGLAGDRAILKGIDRVATQTLRLEIGDRVFFAEGSAELGGKARGVLFRQAQWLRSIKGKVAVIGHADDGGAGEGGLAVDLELSLRRAEAVRGRLIEEGVAENRISVIAMGRDKPIAPCRDKLCGVQNRRAVTVILGE
ncbi:MAG: OmpA family protein [Alphaproteobacteria bacterium]|nr:OmpA family protein [Alphaproteobacteria bacterium]